MSLLLPLGFLGLIGLAALLIIYLIRPNYQTKLVSSTFVWKLSLKYQKKRLPISKIKNLLIVLLQVLILTLCAFILAKPVILDEVSSHNEVVIIIDASASMRATDEEGTTRFERAVTDAKRFADKTFDNSGRVTLIFADNKADYVMHRATSESRLDLDNKLQKMLVNDACTFGSADIDGAMELANSVVKEAPNTRVVLYTATEYKNHGAVDVRNMAHNDGSEWNVAVLDVRAEKTVENTYSLYVDLACYGRDIDITLNLTVNDANSKGNQLIYTLRNDPLHAGEKIRLVGNRVTTVTIQTDVVVPNGNDKAVPVFSFGEATASVQVDDSLKEDNTFSLFGNNKPSLNIQYASTRPNSFFAAAFMSLQSALAKRWNVNYREVRVPESGVIGGIWGGEPSGVTIATTGYDLYVFEDDAMPAVLPADGIVFFVNPSSNILPSGVDFRMSASASSARIPLAPGADHPITKNVFPANIEVTRHKPIIINNNDANDGYTTLLYCQGSSVLACKNTAVSKVMVMSFSLNYSTAAMVPDFPRLILNAVNYFIPSTFEKSVYEVNETVTLNSRGVDLAVVGPEIDTTYTTFPQTLELKRIGTYTTTHTPISGSTTSQKFFVRIPKQESNILREEAALKNSPAPIPPKQDIEDLYVYFAGVLVVLLVVERLLQARSLN